MRSAALVFFGSVTLGLLGYAGSSRAQEPGAGTAPSVAAPRVPTWRHTYGSQSSQWARAVMAQPSGDIVVVGTSGIRGWQLHLDRNGEQLGSTFFDLAADLPVRSQSSPIAEFDLGATLGGVVLAGGFFSLQPLSQYYGLIVITDPMASVRRYFPFTPHATAWEIAGRRGTSSMVRIPVSAVPLADLSFFLAGYYQDHERSGFNESARIRGGWIAKFAPDEEKGWHEEWAHDAKFSMRGAASFPDGGVVVAADPFDGDDNRAAGIARTDPDGAILWAWELQDALVEDTAVLDNGNVAVSVRTRDFEPVYSLYVIAAPGQVVWQTELAGSVLDLHRTFNDQILVVGATRAPIGGNRDGWVALYGAGGRELWQRTIGNGPEDDYFAAADQLRDGDLVLAGAAEKAETGALEAWVMTLRADGSD